MNGECGDPNLDALTIAPMHTPVESMLNFSSTPIPRIPGYELLREIGRGGMGVVYLARQLSINRLVAIKTIDAGDNEEFARLLASEAEIVGKLNHPSIVPVYEASVAGNVWYYSMGLVQGRDLAKTIADGVLKSEEVTRLGVALCDALEHAHALNVLHLDIKPANILLDSSGKSLLTDFGLSAIHGSRFNEHAVLGTPQFMSPEQALNNRADFSPQSDIYAVGAVLYAAIAGRPPIVSSDTNDLLFKVVSQPPPPLRELNPRAPRPLEAIIMKCLQKKPLQRYTSAAELRDDLLAFRQGQPIKARAPGVLSMLGYQLRRHVFAATLSGSAAVLLLLLVGLVFLRTWSQANDIESLQTENDRLGRLVTLQTELMRGRIKRDSFAVQLAQRGDLRRSALFAALTLLEVEESNAPPELMQIIDRYSELSPSNEAGKETYRARLARIIRETDDVAKTSP